MEYEEFLRVVSALGHAKVDYILVGGVAVNLHGVLRATEDIDLFVSPEEPNIERLKQALRSLWDDPDIDTFTASDFAGDYPTLRYAPPDSDLIIDILTRLGTKFRYEDLEYESVELDGVLVRVATSKQLIEMKKNTLRPIDRADVEALGRQQDRKEEGD